jgi:cyanophycinase
MPGTIALQGGGPFSANDDLDRRLLAAAGAERVIVLPTADAFEQPMDLVAAAMLWAERVDVEVEALMVFTRSEAEDPGPAGVVRGARAVHLVGDSPIHLRSVLKDTTLYAAILDVLAAGGLITGVAGSAVALCDPMTDPRGGAFTIGLGMVTGLALATGTETWTEGHLHRTLTLADVTVAELPTGAAIVHSGDGWATVGDAVIHGDLASAAVVTSR